MTPIIGSFTGRFSFGRAARAALLVAAGTIAGAAGISPALARQACPDADLDAYADCTVPSCSAAGLTCGDCDDADPTIHPGAVEDCNHRDDDCDGLADEGSPQVTFSRSILDPLATPQETLGGALAGLGDVTGDGIRDLAAGAVNDDPGGIGNAGSVLIFSGADLSFRCRLVDPGAAGSDLAGSSVAAIGDVTGDGVGDVLVGSPLDDTAQGVNAGSVLLFDGATCAFVRKMTDTAGAGSDQLGASVGAVGDLTGDGRPEILAGAPLDDTAQGTDAGSLLLFNGATGSLVRKLTDTGGATADQLGAWVAGIGDLTGDGLPEILAGAPLDDTPVGSNSGSVLIFDGAAGTAVRRLVDTTGAGSDQVGSSLVAIPDITGDGLPDVAAGAPFANTPMGSNAGAVVLFNAATGAVIRRLIDATGGTGDRLGVALVSIPDADADGVADILAGAPFDDTASGIDAGSLLVLSAATGALVHKLQSPAGAFSDTLGAAVAFAGDLDGDDAPEYVAGTPNAESLEESGTGRLAVFSIQSDCDGDGQPPGQGDCDDAAAGLHAGNQELCNGVDDDCDALVDEDDDGDGYGKCADCDDANPLAHPGGLERCNGADDDCDGSTDEGGDLDGDGAAAPCDCDDASPARRPGAAETCNRIDDNCDGRVDEGFALPALVIKRLDPAPSAGARLGTAAVGLGDVSGDGVPDLAVGAPSDDPSVGANAGSILVVSGADLSIRCRATDPAGASADQLGKILASTPDLTGDGRPDLLAGIPDDDTALGVNAGSVALFNGSTCAFVRRFTDPAGSASAAFGSSVAAVSDLTGDGLPDLLAGSETDDTPRGADAGSVLLFNGATGAFIRKMTDPAGRLADHLGASVTAVGDFDFDHVTDIAAGAPLDDTLASANSGTVLIFSGANGSLIRKIIDPAAGADQIGTALVSPGDLTGDGVPDIAASAPLADPGVSDAGAVLIIDGATGAIVRRITDPAASTGERLGSSLALLPDLSGDRLPDLLAGSPLHDAAAAQDAGRAVILDPAAGGVPRRLDDPDGALGDHLGASVAVAGRVAAGFASWFAGAPEDDGAAGIDQGSFVSFVEDADCDGDGVSPASGDCDDANPAVHAGRAETCDGLDNDCDTLVDEGLTGTPELCNGLDDDCNGLTDEGDPGGGGACATGEAGICAAGEIHCGASGDTCVRILGPGPELCNGADDDCDGVVDESSDSDGDGFVDCSDNCADAFNPGQQDADDDGFGDACDCTPADPSNPPPPEVGDTLAVTGGGVASIGWSAVPSVNRYNVYRGYRTEGNAWQYDQQCLAGRLSATATDDALAPRKFTLFYYFVSSACGSNSESALGRDSTGLPAPNADPCPSATLDTDGDGAEEAADNCAGFRNPSQSDVDGDSHGDACDSCVSASNPSQQNSDNDGFGDACDPDDDNDGVADDGDGSGIIGDNRCTGGATLGCDDNCPTTPNPSQADGDGDRTGDACDPT